MIYTQTVNVPANTSSSSPVCERIQVTGGLVYKIELMFPPGCAGLVHVVINDGGFQVWPSSPESDFAADGYTISFDDTYLKTVEPLEFQVYAYNEDDTYEHNVQVRIGLVDKDIYIARFLPTYGYKELKAMIESMEAVERQRAAKLLEKPFAFI